MVPRVAHCKCNSVPYFWRRRHFISADIESEGEFRDYSEGVISSRERYSGSNEVNCSSDDQSDCREQEYDGFDGTSSRPNRSSNFLLESMIPYVNFMLPTPWRPVVSLS